MEECYTLLGISPTATTEEIEAAYLDKKNELAPNRFEQNSEEWQRASSMLKELDRAYNDAIMATFSPVKAFAAPVHSPIEKRPENTPGEVVVHIENAEDLDDLVEEVPVSFSDEQLLCLDAEQLRESYESFQEKSVFLTWGIKNDLLRRYVMTYAAFAILGLFILMLVGRPTHTVISAMSAQQANISARQAEQSAELLYSIAAAHSHLQIDSETAQQIRESAQQIRDATEQTREAEQQARAAAIPPSMLIAVLMVFVATGHYFFCALPVPVILRFFVMGEPVSGRMFYVVSMFTASMLHLLTSRLLGNWAGSALMLAFVTVLLTAITLKYE